MHYGFIKPRIKGLIIAYSLLHPLPTSTSESSTNTELRILGEEKICSKNLFNTTSASEVLNINVKYLVNYQTKLLKQNWTNSYILSCFV